MKTLDRKYLSTHPEGDEKAVLSFSGKVPAGIDVPANPDGTRASVTLRVTAENYMDAVQAMHALHEDQAEQFLWELIEGVVTEAEAAAVASKEDAMALLKTHASRIVTPSRTLTVEMAILAKDSSGTETSSDVVLELTTPSIDLGIALAINVSQPQKLGQVMIGLCPETEDDDDAPSNEVLVIS